MVETFNIIDILSVKKLTETKIFVLLEAFKTFQAIKEAQVRDLEPLVGGEIAREIVSMKPTDELKRKYEQAEKLNIKVVPYYSELYPDWLKEIPKYPPVLFIRGNFQKEDRVSVAVIGTRGATVYGRHIAENFAREFVEAGVVVVSGMARGIDTAAHWGAIKNGGRTIAVLGCGVDICYPPENRELLATIIKNGVVISEFNLGIPPLAQNFPKRNRIISGLAMGVVAIEAKEHSGVMNTVNWALNQNKDVFAIPGNIFAKTSAGTNRLIKDGAIPVTGPDDVLESLGIKYTRKERKAKEIILNEEEKVLWEQLSTDPIYLDELSEKLNRPTNSILQVLLALEIKGLIRQLPGMMFVKNFE